MIYREYLTEYDEYSQAEPKMSNIQELQAENGFLKEMVKFYREQQTDKDGDAK